MLTPSKIYAVKTKAAPRYKDATASFEELQIYDDYLNLKAWNMSKPIA